MAAGITILPEEPIKVLNRWLRCGHSQAQRLHPGNNLRICRTCKRKWLMVVEPAQVNERLGRTDVYVITSQEQR